MPSPLPALHDVPLPTASTVEAIGVAARRQIRRTQIGILGFFVIDALLLTGYGVIGAIGTSIGWIYGSVGCALVCVLFGWFWLRGARRGDVDVVVLAQTVLSAVIMLATLVAAPAVGGMILMSLMAVVALAALQLEGRQIVALCLALPVASLALLSATGAEAQIPTHDATESVLTAVWFAWLMAKCTAHNLAGTALRAIVSETNVELNAALQTVERLAATDDLTGLRNRRSILAALDAALDGAPAPQRRVAGAIAVALVDLDSFKNVNDRFGHEVGDDVLCAFGRIATANLRARETIGRYGGEEFLVFFDGLQGNSAATDATDAAERLREVVEAHDWASIADGLRTTVSIGVVVVAHGEDAATAIRRADHALYRAKRLGRNRVESG